MPSPSRRLVSRAVVLALVVVLLAPAAVSAATYEPSDLELRPGAVTEPADGLTVVSVQGFHFQGKGAVKKPARLVAFGPRGDVRWVYNGSNVGARWFYDVDPLPDGNLLVTATDPNGTIVLSLSPETLEPAWVERLPYHDTHDVDLLDDDRLLVANMRNYNASAKRNDDRLLLYDRSTGEVVWEWYFRDHYPRSGGGSYADDWTHVNDVDRIAPGEYLVSVRNFDQVIVVDRDTGEITTRLGADDRREVMYEQHNPQYLEAADGTPTILVADSENARIVEYAREAGGWNRTWELGGPETFTWPRDADRLPDGNTLVVDSLNHRVVEVTPTGRIVWEVYAPWGTYDAERVAWGDEAERAADLPTIADLNATGRYDVAGSAGLVPGTGDRLTVAQRLVRTTAGTPVEDEIRWFALRWAHVSPWVYPVWMDGWDFLGVLVAGLLLGGWLAGETVLERHRIAAYVRRHVP